MEDLNYFDIQFEIKQFNIEQDILIVKCYSSILKHPAEYYPEYNLGIHTFDLQTDLKMQIAEKCRLIIKDLYNLENQNFVVLSSALSALSNEGAFITKTEFFNYLQHKGNAPTFSVVITSSTPIKTDWSDREKILNERTEDINVKFI